MATVGFELNPLKMAAADAAVDLVEDGMIVGLGSGSTASLAVTQNRGARRARVQYRWHAYFPQNL